MTERNFEAICRTFKVNPNWLRNGVGEVFVENKESALKNIVEKFNLEPDEAALIGALLELPKDYRAGVVKYVKRLAVMFEENERAVKEPELTKEKVNVIIETEIEAVRQAQKNSLKELTK